MDSVDIINSIRPTIKGSLDYGLPGKVWFGRLYQGEQDIEYTFNKLKENNVSVVVNLLEKPIYGEEESKFFEISYHIPIRDYDVPSDKETFIYYIKAIISLLKEGKNIYVHCFGGRGRTGLFLLALAAKLGKDTEEWKNIIYKSCGGPETEEQIKFGVNCA